MALSEQTLALIDLLFSTYPAFQSGDARTALTAYDITLAGLPEQDISSGLKLFLQGMVDEHNKSFAPPAPLVGTVIRNIRDGRLHREKWNTEAIAQIEARQQPKEHDEPTRKVFVQRMFDGAVVLESEAALTPEAIAKKKAAAAAYLEAHDKTFDIERSPEATARRLGYTVGDPDGDRDVA